MLHWTVIFSVLFALPYAEDPLVLIDWKHKPDKHVPGPWMNYIQAIIVEFGLKESQHILCISFLKQLSSNINTGTLVRKKVVKLLSWFRKMKTSIIFSPITSLQIFDELQDHEKSPRANIQNRVWYFHLHIMLRLKFKIYKMAIMSIFWAKCFNKVVLTSSGSTVFCGIYHQFNFYPFARQTSLQLHYVVYHDFQFHALFDIISPNIVASIGMHHKINQQIHQKPYQVLLLKKKQMVNAYYLTAQKFQILSLELQKHSPVLFLMVQEFLPKNYQNIQMDCTKLPVSSAVLFFSSAFMSLLSTPTKLHTCCKRWNSERLLFHLKDCSLLHIIIYQQ